MPIGPRREKDMTAIAGILLAAGTSRRMGRLKQLLPIGEFSLIESILGEALRSLLDPVILVLGHQGDRIIRNIRPPLCNDPKLLIIDNPDYKEGLSTSIITGLSTVEEEYDQVMFLLSDMPYLSTSIINHLINKYRKCGKDLCAFKIGERRSLPVIVGRKYYSDIHRLTGDIGARELFDKYAAEVALIDAPKGYQDQDLDTPEEYEAYLKKIMNGSTART